MLPTASEALFTLCPQLLASSIQHIAFIFCLGASSALDETPIEARLKHPRAQPRSGAGVTCGNPQPLGDGTSG